MLVIKVKGDEDGYERVRTYEGMGIGRYEDKERWREGKIVALGCL